MKSPELNEQYLHYPKLQQMHPNQLMMGNQSQGLLNSNFIKQGLGPIYNQFYTQKDPMDQQQMMDAEQQDSMLKHQYLYQLQQQQLQAHNQVMFHTLNHHPDEVTHKFASFNLASPEQKRETSKLMMSGSNYANHKMYSATHKRRSPISP